MLTGGTRLICIIYLTSQVGSGQEMVQTLTGRVRSPMPDPTREDYPARQQRWKNGTEQSRNIPPTQHYLERVRQM